jgi:hypothetical protein
MAHVAAIDTAVVQPVRAVTGPFERSAVRARRARSPVRGRSARAVRRLFGALVPLRGQAQKSDRAVGVAQARRAPDARRVARAGSRASPRVLARTGRDAVLIVPDAIVVCIDQLANAGHRAILRRWGGPVAGAGRRTARAACHGEEGRQAPTEGGFSLPAVPDHRLRGLEHGRVPMAITHSSDTWVSIRSAAVRIGGKKPGTDEVLGRR